MLPHHVQINMEYDNPEVNDVNVLVPNMWTDSFLSRHGGINYNGGGGYTWVYSGGAVITDPPSVFILSAYDVAHTSNTTILQAGVTSLYEKAGTVSTITTESLTFTSEMSTSQMLAAGHACTVSMYPTGNSLFRNFWVQGMAFSWDSEIFYVEQPIVAYQYTSASVAANATTLSMYGVSGMRIGMPVRLTRSVSEVCRVATVGTTSIGISGLTVTGGTNTNAYQQGTAVLGDGALVYTNKSTLNGSVGASATSFAVTDASAFAANQPFTVYDNTNWESHTIDHISSNTIYITGGLSYAYGGGTAVLGGFKSSHTTASTIVPLDHYGMVSCSTTFASNEGTVYGTGQPIRTIALRCTVGTSISSYPAIIILLPFGILKDNGTYSGTLTLKYYYWTVGRWHV